MGFLKRLTQSGQAQPSTPPAPGRVLKIGPAAGDPVARALVERMLKGDWQAFADAVEREPDKRRRDFYLTVAADTFQARPEWIVQWPKQRPDFGPALLLRGMQATDWAWQARGHLRGSETSAEAFALFHERLAMARVDIEQSTGMLAGDALPWAGLLPVYMGLGAPIDTFHRVWAEIQERDPWHPEGAPKMVTAIAAKWRGSDEVMWRFVRTTLAQAPEGSTVHEATALAHWHVFTDRGTRDYFNEPGVRNEIHEAAAKSIDLRRGDRDPWLVRARANFAIVYWWMRDIDRLREELIELDDTICGMWLRLDKPGAYWRGARQDAGLDPDPGAR